MQSIDSIRALVLAFIRGEADFRQFNQKYDDLFRDLPDEVYDESPDTAFLSQIHERLDWTASDVSPQDRADGWITAVEFKDWLKGAYPRTWDSVGG